MTTFSWPVRVYYEDTDAGGVVFYANYLSFMERARTELLRSFGIEQDALRDEYGLLFVVRSVSVDYLKPARFNDKLDVTVTVLQRGRASITFDQRILRRDGGDVSELCSGRVKIACVSAADMRPSPIPEFIQTEIARVS